MPQSSSYEMAFDFELLSSEIRGGDRYDWVDFRSQDNRSPREYPYSFSGHYKWREFDKRRRPKGVDAVHSDRMMHWDAEKYRDAFHEKGRVDSLSKDACKEIIQNYYDGKYACVGYALECNVSNGYPIGVFFLNKVAQD